MRMRRKLPPGRSHEKGLNDALSDFLGVLREMDLHGESVRSAAGETTGQFGTRLAYHYTVEIGIDAAGIPGKGMRRERDVKGRGKDDRPERDDKKKPEKTAGSGGRT